MKNSFIKSNSIKNRVFRFIILLGLLTGNNNIYSQSNPTHIPREITTIDPNISGFYEYLPVNYTSENPSKYPLIIYINGNQLERQYTPLSTLLGFGPAKLINNRIIGNSGVKFKDSYKAGGTGSSFKFIVLTIQIKYDSYNTNTKSSTINQNTIDNMIEYAKANYRVDPSRIYLCGFSMGGGAIWNYIAKNPSSKVAVVVISAGAMNISGFDTPAINQDYYDPNFGSIPSEAKNIVSKNIPILCTHNQDDNIITFPRVVSNINKLNSLGMNPTPKLVSWNRGKHFSWARTFEDIDFGVITQAPPLSGIGTLSGNATDALGMNVYEWLLQFTLATPTPRPTIPIHYYTQTNGDGDTFYTRNFTTLGNGTMYGLNYLGVSFNAHYNNFNGTIPIMRYFNPQYVDHFYTKDYLAPGSYGYDYEGIEFYAYNYQYPGTVPVHRYYNHILSNHLYTTNFNLYGNGISGYAYEGIEFYAFPANASKISNENSINDNIVNIKEETNLINTTNFTAFPNPTTGFITVKNNLKTIDSVTVNNLFGEEVQIKKMNNSNTELDISNLPKGIYLVKVKSESEEKVLRVIKE